MRIMLHVALDTEKTNEMVRDGTLGPAVDAILAELKPEAVYAHAWDGRRALTLVVDAPDGATLPTLAEPFWLQLGATVEAIPVMNGEELAEGLSRLG
jgi:hypothetical protein